MQLSRVKLPKQTEEFLSIISSWDWSAEQKFPLHQILATAMLMGDIATADYLITLMKTTMTPDQIVDEMLAKSETAREALEDIVKR